MTSRSDRDSRMDALARKISQAVDGEDLFDVACAASGVCAFSICEAFADAAQRVKALELIIRTMRHIIAEDHHVAH